MRPSDPVSSPEASGRPKSGLRGPWRASLAGVGAVLGIAGLVVFAAPRVEPPVVADNKPDPALAGGAGGMGRHPVTIRQPIVQPRVDTGRRDALGQAVTVACGTCHATSAPRRDTRSAAELDEFHQGLEYVHGNLTCLSCHDATNYDQLRLADGRGVPFAETLSLCAQCHGPQYRDYSRGSHGGMTGYWDLTRGPRERNHCVDCHDPHAPRYPEVTPVFPLPPDRGLNAKPSSSHDHE